MKQKNDGEKPHYWRLALAGVGIFLLLALNYLYFREKTSSNSELITRYTRKADPMEKYRNPAVAGLFYAAAPQTLDREVSGYLQAAGGAYEKMPKMLIVPHAGYQYSAPAAARAYRPLAALAGRIKTVILLGPSHRVPVDGLALSSADWFVTPLGKVPVDREMTAGLAAHKGFRINDAAHRDEHSLEVQLPFLQKVLTDFEIVPIVYGAMNPQETAEALLPYLQRDDTLLVVSADLSHYYTYEEAQAASMASSSAGWSRQNQRSFARNRLSSVLRRRRHQQRADFGADDASASGNSVADQFRRHCRQPGKGGRLRRLGLCRNRRTRTRDRRACGLCCRL